MPTLVINAPRVVTQPVAVPEPAARLCKQRAANAESCTGDYGKVFERHRYYHGKCYRCGRLKSEMARYVKKTNIKHKPESAAPPIPPRALGRDYGGDEPKEKRLTIDECLKIFGYTNVNRKKDKKDKSAVSFWHKNYSRLPYILQDLEKIYLLKVQKNESTPQIEKAWNRAEFLFKEHRIEL